MTFSVITAEGKVEIYGHDVASYELQESGILVVTSGDERTVYSPAGWHQIFERDVTENKKSTIFFLPR